MKSIEKYYPFDGKVFEVVVETFEHEDGKKQRLDLVIHSDSVAILAEINDEIILVKQYRHGAGKELWELPAGMVEEGETPEEAALRELEEETGYKADSIIKIVTAYSSPGFCNEKIHLFYCKDLIPGKQNLDEDEQIKYQLFKTHEIENMIFNEEMCDMKTITAFKFFTAWHSVKVI